MSGFVFSMSEHYSTAGKKTSESELFPLASWSQQETRRSKEAGVVSSGGYAVDDEDHCSVLKQNAAEEFGVAKTCCVQSFMMGSLFKTHILLYAGFDLWC